MKIRSFTICMIVVSTAFAVFCAPPYNLSAISSLVNDAPINGIAPVPEFYDMNILSGEFAVAGVRPETGDDFDIELYTDTTFSNLIDSSTYSGDSFDFVALEKDIWNSPPAKGVRITKGSTSYVTEMENDIESHTTSETWNGYMDEYPGNPVLDLGPPGSWDDVYVIGPEILYDGTTYHMWYGGLDGSNRRIGYASSSDGIHWSKYSNNPVVDLGPSSWDNTHLYLPSVVYDGSVYHMWYSGSNGPHYRIGYATSPDGLSWTKPALGQINYEGNTNNNIVLDIGPDGSWDDVYVFSPEVYFDGSVFHMWYSGLDGSKRRIGYATSNDGIAWTKYSGNPVLDIGPSGSWDDHFTCIPRIVHDGSSYHMWYTGHDGSKFGIGYAVSNDGINWKKGLTNPVLDYGSSGSWDDRHLLYPDIIYDGTKFHMWYSGGDGTNIRIGYATSKEFGGWNKHSLNPLLQIGPPGSWDDTYTYFPMVIYDGITYKMWYSGFDGSHVRIGYATSSNGLSWTKYSGNPILDLGPPGSWDDHLVHYPSVVYDGSTYHMWYSGNDDPNYRIGYASSSDGISWTKHPGNPVLDLGPPGSFEDYYVGQASVIYDGSLYKMWYSGLQVGGRGRTGYATSPDGITWTKYSGNPVLDLGPSGSWDDFRAYTPSAQFDGTTYHLWYSGNDGSIYRIGHATSSDGTSWAKDHSNPVLDLGPSGSWDDVSVGACKVINDGSRYMMWYSGGDGSKTETGLATYGSKWIKLTARAEVLDAYEITGLISGNSYTLDLETSPTLDLDFFIYDTTGGREDAVVSSTNMGPGIDESMTFTAPSSGDYLLIITNENGESGEYTIRPGSYPPVADAGEDQTVLEGDVIIFDGSSSYDPQGASLSFIWDFDVKSDSDGDSIPDNDVDSTETKPMHIYGDNGIFTASLKVINDDNLSATDTCNTTVLNIDPSLDMESPIMDVEISLRMAGSKWSNADMTLYEDDQAIGYIEVERWPGSPDDNPYSGDPTIPLSLNLTRRYSAIVTYDPYPDSGDSIRGDQPNNGKDKQNNAGNPVWVVIKFPNGSEERAHHTFNTQQSKKRGSTHPNHVDPWELDIMELLKGHSFKVSSHITDPGSDDIQLSFYYGTQVISQKYLNDPPDPDPYPSPEFNPRDIMDATLIIYEGEGVLIITVEDDDGGEISVIWDLN